MTSTVGVDVRPVSRSRTLTLDYLLSEHSKCYLITPEIIPENCSCGMIFCMGNRSYWRLKKSQEDLASMKRELAENKLVICDCDTLKLCDACPKKIYESCEWCGNKLKFHEGSKTSQYCDCGKHLVTFQCEDCLESLGCIHCDRRHKFGSTILYHEWVKSEYRKFRIFGCC